MATKDAYAGEKESAEPKFPEYGRWPKSIGAASGVMHPRRITVQRDNKARATLGRQRLVDIDNADVFVAKRCYG